MPQSNVSEENHRPVSETTVKFPNAIHVFPDGIRLVAPAKGRKNEHSGKHKRGKIKGWSYASRRRMRAQLMANVMPESYVQSAVTLTIPGYPLQVPEARKLWEKFRTAVKDKGWLCVWRCEIQKRGQLHWHCVIGVDTPPSAAEMKTEIKKTWHRAMRSMGYIEYSYLGPFGDPTQVDYVTGKENLMNFPYAERYSAHVDLMSENGQAWKRYLLDHTTKVKQEQIPENIGRHWGVIGRKRFIEILPERVAVMSVKEYACLLRSINRMFTPYLRNDSALFGRVKGYTVKRGKQGKTDLFTKSRPTIERLIDWVLSDRSEETDSNALA
jgi:hypothetical protein